MNTEITPATKTTLFLLWTVPNLRTESEVPTMRPEARKEKSGEQRGIHNTANVMCHVPAVRKFSASSGPQIG